ncbi:MAG: hypothetical protein J6U44_07240, partial [Paludibacteraceae bacterium]|nr:hypothetical protein [Paludibacteraceae bacterium]
MRIEKKINSRKEKDFSFKKKTDSTPFGAKWNRRGEKSSSPSFRKREVQDENSKYSKKKQLEYKKRNTDPAAPVRLNKFLA